MSRETSDSWAFVHRWIVHGLVGVLLGGTAGFLMGGASGLLVGTLMGAMASCVTITSGRRPQDPPES
ncbi:hypothetical protein OKJ48_29935 [Streptomyces kunmingensis]|uniref:Glycine zipper family protein n=1 Tax=Streptomyces kunmingensis TaxID=68225 RepID=A0ABU6CIG4_9ACTN|nr:hypothetical protein [Streptomyces kunmingensis]MEB3964422.1 hypothetical protein [Streptomyces kunmingensis]